MIKDLVKIKDRVAYVLNKYPSTRDCDKTLWLAYLAIFHQLKDGLGEAKYGVFKSILMSEETPTMESVRRVRQKFQEHGEYPASEGTRKARRTEEHEVRSWALGG